jgi:hypothetical protein
MNDGAVPPAAIGLAAGLLTTAVAVALSVTGLLPAWVTTPLLLLAGGLAAGLAAPVRPTIGALLGAVTGIFAAILLTIVYIVQMASVLGPYYSSPPFALTAGVSILMFTPLNTAAGAVGAAVRPHLVGLRDVPAKPTAEQALERRQWAGIAVGALAILSFMVMWWFAGNLMWQLIGWAIGWADPAPLVLIFSLAGGVAAGFLSAGGVRAGITSGLLSGLLSLAAFALLLILQASMATVHGASEAIWAIALAYMAFWVLPAAVVGGALGGRARAPDAFRKG